MAFALRVFSEDGEPQEPCTKGTLEWFAARYRDHLASRVAGDDYSPRRLKGTMSYVNNFLGFVYREGNAPPLRLGELPVDQARQAHLSAWMVANFQRWTKGSTRADALGAVLGCFGWLEEAEFMVSPFRRPKNLKFPRTHFRAMRTHHFRAIYWAARKAGGSLNFRLIYWCAWKAGVRLIEFRRLEPHEIDWTAGVIRLPRGKHKTGRKTGDDRPIGLGPRLLKVLRALHRRMKPGQKYLFLTARGKPWSKDNLGRRYARYRALAGVPEAIKMCSVRHGYAVRALSDGVTSSKAVADALGHKSTRMVESIYGAETRYDAEGVRDVATNVERAKKRRPAPKPAEKRSPAADAPLFQGLE
jgi:integrase